VESVELQWWGGDSRIFYGVLREAAFESTMIPGRVRERKKKGRRGCQKTFSTEGAHPRYTGRPTVSVKSRDGDLAGSIV